MAAIHRQALQSFPVDCSEHDSFQLHWWENRSGRLFFHALRLFHTESLLHYSYWTQRQEGIETRNQCLCVTVTGEAKENLTSQVESTEGSLPYRSHRLFAVPDLLIEIIPSFFPPARRNHESPPDKLTLRISIRNDRMACARYAFDIEECHTWEPAGHAEGVWHGLVKRANDADNATWERMSPLGGVRHDLETGEGYFKRYFGRYPRHWCYRFVQSSLPMPMWREDFDPRPSMIWTADAQWGRHKYDYFCISRERQKIAADDSYHKHDRAIGRGVAEFGKEVVLRLTPIDKWQVCLKSTRMDSVLTQWLNKCELVVDGKVVCTTQALSETCMGTLG